MTHQWDDFSKSLAEGSTTRRESLRLLGAALAGAVLSPLGLGTARAAKQAHGRQDPCKAICRCSNKRQQDACLAACRSCTGATSRLCGSCGTGVTCSDLAHDVRNCGACGNACLPGPYEDGRVRLRLLRVLLRRRGPQLRRELHPGALRPEQLRRLWQRLRRPQSVLLPGSLRHMHAELPGRVVRRRWLWRGMRLPRGVRVRRNRVVRWWGLTLPWRRDAL